MTPAGCDKPGEGYIAYCGWCQAQPVRRNERCYRCGQVDGERTSPLSWYSCADLMNQLDATQDVLWRFSVNDGQRYRVQWNIAEAPLPVWQLVGVYAITDLLITWLYTHDVEGTPQTIGQLQRTGERVSMLLTDPDDVLAWQRG